MIDADLVELEEGIPIPPRGPGGKKGLRPKSGHGMLTNLLRRMKVGQSFQLPNNDFQVLRATACSVGVVMTLRVGSSGIGRAWKIGTCEPRPRRKK